MGVKLVLCCTEESRLKCWSSRLWFLFSSHPSGSQCQHRRTGGYQSHQTGTGWVLAHIYQCVCTSSWSETERHWSSGPKWSSCWDWTAFKPALLVPFVPQVRILLWSSRRSSWWRTANTPTSWPILAAICGKLVSTRTGTSWTESSDAQKNARARSVQCFTSILKPACVLSKVVLIDLAALVIINTRYY